MIFKIIIRIYHGYFSNIDVAGNNLIMLNGNHVIDLKTSISCTGLRQCVMV